MNQLRYILRTEIRELALLAGPIAAMQLGQISNGFVDVLMVGQLGPASLAGVALGNATYFLFVLVCIGTLMAVGPMVAQAYGAEDYDLIGRSARQGLWLGLALTGPVVYVLWNVAHLWQHMHQDAATIAMAQAYLRAAVWGLLPFLWFIALRSFIEAISRPWPVTFIILTGVGLNALANHALMFGKFGLPALGLVGTGWATAIVNWFMFLALLALVQGRANFRVLAALKHLRFPDFPLIRELLRIGLPIGASYGLEVTLFSAVAFFIGTLGPVPLAAHQIAIQCAAFTFMVPLGIGIATSVRVGRAVGRQEPVRAAWAGYLGMSMAVAFMLCTSILFWLFPRPIVGLFLNLNDPVNEATVAIGASLLGLAALFQIVDGLQVSTAGALRGLKDTRIPMIFCFISYWLLGMPIAAILGFWSDLGAQGFWWGLVAGLLAASCMLGLRFRLLSRRIRRNE